MKVESAIRKNAVKEKLGVSEKLCKKRIRKQLKVNFTHSKGDKDKIQLGTEFLKTRPQLKVCVLIIQINKEAYKRMENRKIGIT